eukprot:1189468-Prorocentrum_minimum.AAC.1
MTAQLLFRPRNLIQLELRLSTVSLFRTCQRGARYLADYCQLPEPCVPEHREPAVELGADGYLDEEVISLKKQRNNESRLEMTDTPSAILLCKHPAEFGSSQSNAHGTLTTVRGHMALSGVRGLSYNKFGRERRRIKTCTEMCKSMRKSASSLRGAWTSTSSGTKFLPVPYQLFLSLMGSPLHVVSDVPERTIDNSLHPFCQLTSSNLTVP